MGLKYLRIFAASLSTVLLLGACSVPAPESLHQSHLQSLADTEELLCIVGDSGIGGPLQMAVSKAMAKVGCSQFRHTGDVIYPKGLNSIDDPLLEDHFFLPYRWIFEQQLPFYLVMGNHDFHGDSATWLRVSKERPLVNFPYYHYSENWGDICIFSLETTWYSKVNFVHKRWPQTQWLRSAMAAQAEQCQFSLAIGHHPLISSGRHGEASWLAAWFLKAEVFGKVDLYLSGHDHHLADEGLVQGTLQLISGAAGQLYPLGEPTPFAKFATSSFGFITLKFLRSEDQQVKVEYKIYALNADGAGDHTSLREVWNGEHFGQGLRLDGD